jgi:hypothetical protein
MKKPIADGKISRWFLLLEELNITILDKPKKDNVVVEFLYRIISNGNDPLAEDYFPDEHLFAVFTNSPWFAYIANCFTAGKILHHLTPKECWNGVGD